MAKVSGLGEVITIDSSAGSPTVITNDITNWTFTTPRAVQDVTGVDKSAHEALLLLADFTCTLNGVFNSTAPCSHDVFKTVTTSAVMRTSVFQVTSNATPSLTVEVVYTDYQLTRANTGEITWQAPGQLADGTPPSWS